MVKWEAMAIRPYNKVWEYSYRITAGAAGKSPIALQRCSNIIFR
jgi:hypothetical protein